MPLRVGLRKALRNSASRTDCRSPELSKGGLRVAFFVGIPALLASLRAIDPPSPMSDHSAMGLITCQGMRDLEEAAFRRGVSAEALMDKAGRRLGEALVRLIPGPGTAVAYLGRGNNAGDALIALQVLRAAGWKIAARCPYSPTELGVLPRRKIRQLGDIALEVDPFESMDSTRPLLLIDGLLGIGARGPLRDPLAALAAEMKELRESRGATIASVDIPSGLNGDTGEPSPGAVRADLTATIAAPKVGLLADSATRYVGRLELIPLEELSPSSDGGDRLTTHHHLRALLPPRAFDSHKGNAGRLGIVAGSRGLLGAAILAATGALRGGAGLVTLYVLEPLYPCLLAAGPPPEAMVKPIVSYREVLSDSHDALAVGPGLGHLRGDDRKALLEILAQADCPLVVDADALNVIAEEGPANHLHKGMVITPHPGELLRLFPEASSLDRAETARQFVNRQPCTLLYKGARTIITAPGEALSYNCTGTPAMATGGQGDVLTGLLGALLAGGLPSLGAAQAAAWLAGRASELAQAGGESEQSLLASDTARELGRAFLSLREAP